MKLTKSADNRTMTCLIMIYQISALPRAQTVKRNHTLRQSFTTY